MKTFPLIALVGVLCLVYWPKPQSAWVESATAQYGHPPCGEKILICQSKSGIQAYGFESIRVEEWAPFVLTHTPPSTLTLTDLAGRKHVLDPDIPRSLFARNSCLRVCRNPRS